MVQVLADPALRATLAAAAPQDAAAWSAGAMALRLAALYAELAAARRVPDYTAPLASARAEAHAD